MTQETNAGQASDKDLQIHHLMKENQELRARLRAEMSGRQRLKAARADREDAVKRIFGSVRR